LGIAALGIAIVYLLVLTAVGVGALWVLVWLFGEAPGEGARTGRETTGGSRSADRFGAGSTPSSFERSGPTVRRTRARETTGACGPDREPGLLGAKPFAEPRPTRTARGRTNGAQ
jgi:hypothetical protein